MRMDRTGAELPILVGQGGPLNSVRWILEEALTIGRDAGCDIVIQDRQVSRFHARLIRQGEGAVIEDLASKNGTFFRGEKIGELQTLQDGDSFQIALIQSFVFLSSDATVPMDSQKLPGEGFSGRLYVDKRSRRVWIKGQELIPSLSVPQFKLLEALFDQDGKVVSRQELITLIWENEEALGVSEQALDALIRRLRDRIALIDPDHQYILTVRGYGLRLENPKE
jgi:hypothetical protein